MERCLRVFVFGFALAATLTPVERAAAQVSSLFLDRWDLGFNFSRNSARLDAMANVWTAVEDESREINMWDYGRNVAGFLDDRDAWTGDFWAATTDLERRTAGVGSSGEVVESGIQLSFRSFQRALGLEGSLTVGSDEQGRGDRHKFTGPYISVVGNQSVGESLVLGVGLRIVNEEEKTTSTDPLSIEHDTARTDVSVGLLYYLGEKIDLGASATFTRNRTSGRSEDGLHRDAYDWDRPSTDVGVQVVYGAESAVQGAAFYRYGRLDGGEELGISWSREFFLNPSGVDLTLRVPLLKEELKETEFGTRWLVELSEKADIGGAVSHLSGTFDARVNPTFPSISKPADEEFTETTLSAGLAIHPVGELTIAGQIDVGERELDAIVLDAPRKDTNSVTSVAAGLEYFWRPDVALRGGFRFGTRSDELQRDGETTTVDFDETEISGGLGWAPGGGVFLLDLAIAFIDGEMQDSDVVDETSGLAFTVTGRTLFK